MHYLPVPGPWFGAFAGLLALVAALIMLKAFTYGYGRMGIPGWAALSLLLASLLGAYVNVPLVHFPDAKVLEVAELRRLGESYPVLAARDWPGMVLAVNVGGAGTFDGVFISGILALLLACLALERLGAKSRAF